MISLHNPNEVRWYIIRDDADAVLSFGQVTPDQQLDSGAGTSITTYPEADFDTYVEELNNAGIVTTDGIDHDA